MTARRVLVLLTCAVISPLLWAKLPPPTLEEQQAAAQRKAQQQAQEEQQKKALDAAQDRVVEYYRRNHAAVRPSTGPGAGGTSGSEERNALPKTTRELPGEAGPQGGREPSAEAHSAPAK